MPFEDNLPESFERYPYECDGEVSLNDDGVWICNSCDFFYNPKDGEE